ncbi:hypothetical protein [Sphingomonas sp.]|uniref:hypothetical protein n=1 Tax=Sphingomonas sp. TaxID=28214 RepID=UPI001EB8257D|nr:hypothetical protein [Sphingomonas sp.]MBX3594977.1 hypothetical protein [Sphingomonas sp.]
MLKPVMIAIALAFGAQPVAAAERTTLGQFLARWDALEARPGDVAEDDPERLALWELVSSAAKAYRQRIADAVAAGQPAPGCPPPPGQAQLDSDEFMPRLRTLPPERRDQPFDQAMFGVLDAIFPCL